VSGAATAEPVRRRGRTIPWRRPGRVAAAAVAAWSAVVGTAVGLEVVPLGDGPSPIVEYDRDLHPIRRFAGLHKPVDITPIGSDRLLIVDEAAEQVILARRDGAVLWREAIGGAPLRARPRPGGGYLVTTAERVIAVRESRAPEWEVAVRGLRTAVPLPGGGALAASNDGQGWLTELTPEGRTVWRSPPRAARLASGEWVSTPATETFVSLWALDVGADGRIFTSDFDGGGLRLLDGSHHLLSEWKVPDFPHVTDARVGPAGELVAVSAEASAVWIGRPGGAGRRLDTDLTPWCAALTRQGTLLVGLEWRPEAEILNATAARSAPRPEAAAWYRSPVIVALVGLVVALAVVVSGLAPDRRRATPAPAVAAERVEPGEGPLPASGPLRARGVVLALAAAGALVAITGVRLLVSPLPAQGLWLLALGCLLAGAALQLLGRLEGEETALSSFAGPEPPGPTPSGAEALRRRAMAALAVAALAACLALESAPGSMAAAVGLWIAAQVLAVGASLVGKAPGRTSPRAGRGHGAALASLLVVTAAMRLWQIGDYPDWVHHDHSIYGDAALRLMRGEWQPFFVMDPQVHAIARPWMAVCAAALSVFGAQYWVLRLTGAIAGVLTVLGTYLLGKALLNRNVGLLAAALVGFNHVLLLHSRQPFILEPVPLFVFCVLLFVKGVKDGNRFGFCASGVLAAWTLMAYWASLSLAAAGAAIAVGLVVFRPRWMVARLTRAAWFLLGLAVAYAPMVASMLPPNAVTNRVSDLSVLLNPDGSIRWNAALWGTQTVRSFGAFVLFPDRSAWFLETKHAICSPLEVVLLGVGLVVLLTARRTAAALVLLPWIAVTVFLGSAVLPEPPSYYHFLAALVPAFIICAIPLERVLAWGTASRPRWTRIAALCGVLAALSGVGWWQVEDAWGHVRRPPKRNGWTVYNADEKSLVARFVGDNPEFRYYLVRSRHDVSVASPIFLFFAADSDMSDLTGDVAGALPVAPVRPAPAAAFVVLSSRAGEIATLRRRYPGGRELRLHFSDDAPPTAVYVVDADAIDLEAPPARRSGASPGGRGATISP